MTVTSSTKKIVLFDGVCNMCNSFVLFAIKRDKKDILRFTSLQSEIGQKLISERNIDTSKIDSILLIEPGVAYYTKAEAALKIGQTFGGLWKTTWILEQLPSIITNTIYDFIAKNRYRWFGKKESCMLPTPELIEKFLE
ncbi:MAG: DCC1-like thiol-disulfide oxidoreductase family protein [Cellulophaga sp.]